MIKSQIFTKNQLELIKKRMSGSRLTQIESNYLSRAIRPKLREIASTNANWMLNKMKYSQKIKSIEEKIRKSTVRCISGVNAIILYGSAIQTNYQEYQDIDILILTSKEITHLKEKIKKITELKTILKKQEINADIEIYCKSTIEKAQNQNPSLLYQLKDSKIIYGNFKTKNNPQISKTALQMKLDWSYLEENPKGIEVYKAIRNTFLVKLLLSKIIDNQKLKESLNDEIGKSLAQRLKNSQESKIDKKIALMRLKELLKETEKTVAETPWEKIKL